MITKFSRFFFIVINVNVPDIQGLLLRFFAGTDSRLFPMKKIQIPRLQTLLCILTVIIHKNSLT